MCHNICVKPAEGYNLFGRFRERFNIYAEAITLYFQRRYFKKEFVYNYFNSKKERCIMACFSVKTT